MKKRRHIFSMTMTVLLTGSLLAPTTEAASFPDVYPNEKAYTAVEELLDRDLISGFPDGTFRQNEPVTRAQSAIFVGRVHGIDVNDQIGLPFKDLSPKQAAYPYIAYYVNNGVFDLSERFYPNRPLTRAEMARTVVKALALNGTPDKPFSDVPSTHPDAVYIHALAANGLTSGVGHNKYDPDGIVTRGQMAIFMLNIDNFIGPDQEPEHQPIYDIDPHFTSNATEQQIFLLVNNERINAGVQPLKLANDLSHVARVKSKDMRDLDYFDHTSPTYRSPFKMMDDFGLDYTSAGENIAAGQDTAIRVMNSWMNSLGHRQNILNPDFTEIGIGYVEGGDYGSYFTQMFMTR